MSDALKAVDITLSSFKNQRSDAVFDEFYDSVVVLSAGKSIWSSGTESHRKAKKFFDATNSAAAHVYATPKDYFRHKYYEAVDVVIAELERRFDRSSSSQVVVTEIEQFLLDAANGKQIDEMPTSVKSLHKTDLDLSRRTRHVTWRGTSESTVFRQNNYNIFYNMCYVTSKWYSATDVWPSNHDG